jgi:hypothetical protein
MTTTCPLCHGPLLTQPGAKQLGERADCFEDRREMCQACRIALTNATGSLRTFIKKDWKDGLWRPETATRLERVVAGSLSEVSRAKKTRRLAHERSEDLLTWNVFSWLEDHGRLEDVVTFFGCDGSTPVQAFYWGFNDRHSFPTLSPGMNLRRFLAERFRESLQGLSEPDVILFGDRHVIFVEAKLGSPNEQRANDVRVDKYVKAMPEWFADPDRVRAAGYYELTRNWAIGAALATDLGKAFMLVSLVRAADEQGIEGSFGPVLAPRGVFRRCTWEHLSGIEPAIRPWLQRQTLHFQPAFPGLGEAGDSGRSWPRGAT